MIIIYYQLEDVPGDWEVWVSLLGLLRPPQTGGKWMNKFMLLLLLVSFQVLYIICYVI